MKPSILVSVSKEVLRFADCLAARLTDRPVALHFHSAAIQALI